MLPNTNFSNNIDICVYSSIEIAQNVESVKLRKHEKCWLRHYCKPINVLSFDLRYLDTRLPISLIPFPMLKNDLFILLLTAEKHCDYKPAVPPPPSLSGESYWIYKHDCNLVLSHAMLQKIRLSRSFSLPSHFCLSPLVCDLRTLCKLRTTLTLGTCYSLTVTSRAWKPAPWRVRSTFSSGIAGLQLQRTAC